MGKFNKTRTGFRYKGVWIDLESKKEKEEKKLPKHIKYR